MKKTIILCVAIFAAFTAFAQNTMATLNHNDTVTVYYGIGALRRAYTAAVDGDVITLSSGTFYTTNIYKAITIRGAGMCYDSLTNTYPTILIDSSGINTTISVDGTPNQRLELEGLWYTGNAFYYRYLRHGVFRKIRLNWFAKYDTHYSGQPDYYCRNCQFVQCFFQSGCFSFMDTNSRTNTFINCAICSMADGYYTLHNCVANVSGSMFSAYNSILFTTRGMYGYTMCSASAYRCIGWVNGNASDEYFSAQQRAYNHTIYGNDKAGQVFRVVTPYSQSTGYSSDYDSQKFFLTDSIIAVYPGSDGTQVGIYGGAAPFNPRPDYIRIQQCTVAPRTTPDGKLNVDIEVVNEH